MKGAIIVM